MGNELHTLNTQNKLALWAGRISECRDSGQRVKDWCRENRISEQTYYRWQRRLFEMAQTHQEIQFAETTPVQPARSGNIAVTIRLAGAEADIHSGADTATVERSEQEIAEIKGKNMRLEESDAELFYRLWIPLLDFVNRKYHVCPETKSIDQRQGVDVQVAKAVADYLWSHSEVIGEYLASTELPEEYVRIVADWKRCKPGRYIVERHLKKGSVFISAEDGIVYMVKGLFSTWEEMLGKGPVLLDAVLIPFRDSIISDGLVMPYRIHFGRGAAEGFKEEYMNAKRNKTIRFSIWVKKAEASRITKLRDASNIVPLDLTFTKCGRWQRVERFSMAHFHPK